MRQKLGTFLLVLFVFSLGGRAEDNSWVLESGRGFAGFPTAPKRGALLKSWDKKQYAVGEAGKVTLWPNDAKRRLQLDFGDDGVLDSATVFERSFWRLPGGFRVGDSVAVLEKANGRPFELKYVQPASVQKNAGLAVPLALPHPVVNWRGGRLESLSSARYDLYFTFQANSNPNTHVPGPNFPSEKEIQAWLPRTTFTSDDPMVRRMNASLAFFQVKWPASGR